MPWDPTKPAGTDAANTIDTSCTDNFAALDTWASGFTGGVAAGAPTYLSVGTNPATAGLVRLARNITAISGRNVGNTANIGMVGIDTSDAIFLGDANDATTDIRWGRALIALGGGAAPTLGTIGGSGPATAAQNSWLRVMDSAGVAAWIPVWK